MKKVARVYEDMVAESEAYADIVLDGRQCEVVEVNGNPAIRVKGLAEIQIEDCMFSEYMVDLAAKYRLDLDRLADKMLVEMRWQQARNMLTDLILE